MYMATAPGLPMSQLCFATVWGSCCYFSSSDFNFWVFSMHECFSPNNKIRWRRPGGSGGWTHLTLVRWWWWCWYWWLAGFYQHQGLLLGRPPAAAAQVKCRNVCLHVDYNKVPTKQTIQCISRIFNEYYNKTFGKEPWTSWYFNICL